MRLNFLCAGENAIRLGDRAPRRSLSSLICNCRIYVRHLKSNYEGAIGGEGRRGEEGADEKTESGNQSRKPAGRPAPSERCGIGIIR